MDKEKEITYRHAVKEDLESLVKSRLDFIHLSAGDPKYELTAKAKPYILF